MTRLLLLAFTLVLSNDCMTQNADSEYFKQIPDAPDTYNEFTTVARLIDGLGYRYYWGSEGLREEDLSHQPSEDSRTSREVLEHIYSLCRTISLTVQGQAITRSLDHQDMDFNSLRNETMAHLKMASELLRTDTVGSMEDLKIRFQRGESTTEFPFWNMINGPIADALWHTGQIVSNRRASGNPLNPNVSVLRGKTRN
ncbi:MAG: hypothetical protein HKN09_02280 [Saprospiraceae bacterium]|nr:hypothetical protein [Saprospiraceae bacterium]